MLKLVIALFFSLVLAGDWLSCKEYDDVYRAIDDFISHDVHNIPGLVRLAFHDCVGKSCDGCLNFKDDSNAGLDHLVHKLDEIWEHQFHHVLSRSDFWQLASQVGLVRGGLNRGCHTHDKHKECTFFDIQFWWGRKDCHTSPYHHHDDDTGDAHGDFHEVYRVLNGNFGLDDKEIVAILGTHSLGGSKRHESGFDYNWQKHELTFDNQFYKNLISLPYTHEDVAYDPHHTRLQFTWIPHDHHDEKLLMLNTDMSLWKKVDAIEKHHHFTGELKCPIEHSHNIAKIPEHHEDFVHHCEDAKTAHVVHDFAYHLDHFFDTFENAWWKMVSNGYYHHDLKKPGQGHEHCGNCIPHGAFCVEGFEKSGKCCPGSHCVHNKCV